MPLSYVMVNALQPFAALHPAAISVRVGLYALVYVLHELIRVPVFTTVLDCATKPMWRAQG